MVRMWDVRIFHSGHFRFDKSNSPACPLAAITDNGMVMNWGVWPKLGSPWARPKMTPPLEGVAYIIP